MKLQIAALRKALDDQNWSPALAFALTFPDVCGSASGAQQGRRRYVDWCNKYLAPFYSVEYGGYMQAKQFLTGDDCYALRCAYLHSGELELDDPRNRATVARFHFSTSPNIHNNLIGDILQLNLQTFCGDMCVAAEHWLVDVAVDADVQSRLSSFPDIKAFTEV